MTWLTPLVGAIGAAILVPTLIILYFLKLRRRDVEISTTLLWKKSIQDLQANAPFQKLRRNLLLFLQLLVLAACLFALAQPQFMGQRAVGEQHVILIDRSASMQALDANEARSKTRLEAAKEEAIEFIQTLREPGLFGGGTGDEAMVIAFDSKADVRLGFTNDKNALEAAINGIEATDSRSELDQAVRLARAHAPPRLIEDEIKDENGNVIERRFIELPSGAVGTIHIFSDGRLRGTEKAETDPEDEVLYHPQGDPDSVNIGITSLRADRSFKDPTQLSVFVGLSSTDPSPRVVDVELLIDGVAQRIREVELPGTGAGSTGGAEGEALGEIPEAGLGGTTFEFDRPTGGVVTVRVNPRGEDVLPNDDRAWVVVPPARSLRVGVAGKGTYVLRKALAALEPQIGVDEISEDEVATAFQEGAYDVIVLDGWMPDPPEDSDDPLPPGRWLVMGAVPGAPLGMTPVGEADRAIVLNWSRDHPALRGVSLGNVGFAEVTRYEIPDTSVAEPLATTDVGPAIVEMVTARMRALVVAHDVEKSIWWQDISFPWFIGKAVRYLGEEGSTGLAHMVQPGEVISDRLPQGATNITVESPRGERTSVPQSDDGRIVYGPVDQAGIYTIRWTGEAGAGDGVVNGRVVRAFTANLLSTHESDTRTMESLNLPAHLVAGETGGNAAQTIRIWPWLLLAGLGILMFEWFIYNRKVYV